ncbi:MAG: hypothetical protein WC992_00370 [Acholeplasmataceae bacterium]|jgi:hypothetical protein
MTEQIPGQPQEPTPEKTKKPAELETRRAELVETTLSSLTLSPSGDFGLHLLRVDDRGVQTLKFEGLASFLENLGRFLRDDAGLPVRIFAYHGHRIRFSTPQVAVGVSLPGSDKGRPVLLARSEDNDSGDVPAGL